MQVKVTFPGETEGQWLTVRDPSVIPVTTKIDVNQPCGKRLLSAMAALEKELGVTYPAKR